MVMAEQLISGQVIEACQQGDRAAFQLLFETYKDKVFSIAVYSSGGDRAVADDVTQQIFLKLFTAIRQFRGVYDVALSSGRQCMSRRTSPPQKMAAAGRDCRDEQSER